MATSRRRSTKQRPRRTSVAGARANKISLQTTLRVNNAVKSIVAQNGNHVGKAAEIIANGIKTRARGVGHGVSIPPNVYVGQATEQTATIYAAGQPAVIIETGGRHPLFARGPRDAPDAEKHGWGHWYTQKRILFMEEGAKLALNDAAKEFGLTVDDWLTEYE